MAASSKGAAPVTSTHAALFTCDRDQRHVVPFSAGNGTAEKACQNYMKQMFPSRTIEGKIKQINLKEQEDPAKSASRNKKV